MKKQIVGVTAFCMIAWLIIFLPTEAQPPGPATDLQQAARQGLQHFLSTNPPAELALLGFPNPDDVGNASLGTPYELRTLTEPAMQAYQPGASLAPVLASTDTWLFPVLVGGEARAVLTVSSVQGRWEAVDLGGGGFAAQLQAASAKLTPALAQQRAEIARPVQIVVLPELEANFLYVQASSGEFLMPLTSAQQAAASVDADRLQTVSETLAALRLRSAAGNRKPLELIPLP